MTARLESVIQTIMDTINQTIISMELYIEGLFLRLYRKLVDCPQFVSVHLFDTTKGVEH